MSTKTAGIVAGGLLLAGFLARLAPHPPNVTPVAALAHSTS